MEPSEESKQETQERSQCLLKHRKNYLKKYYLVPYLLKLMKNFFESGSIPNFPYKKKSVLPNQSL